MNDRREPEARPGESGDWSDEWNRDDWYELNRADRDYRNEESWSDWLIKFGIVAIVLPLVLGFLAWVLIVLL